MIRIASGNQRPDMPLMAKRFSQGPIIEREKGDLSGGEYLNFGYFTRHMARSFFPIGRQQQKRKSPTTELDNKAHQLAWKAEYVTNQEIKRDYYFHHKANCCRVLCSSDNFRNVRTSRIVRPLHAPFIRQMKRVNVLALPFLSLINKFLAAPLFDLPRPRLSIIRRCGWRRRVNNSHISWQIHTCRYTFNLNGLQHFYGFFFKKDANELRDCCHLRNSRRPTTWNLFKNLEKKRKVVTCCLG